MNNREQQLSQLRTKLNGCHKRSLLWRSDAHGLLDWLETAVSSKNTHLRQRAFALMDRIEADLNNGILQ